jgi:hypothetical protein
MMKPKLSVLAASLIGLTTLAAAPPAKAAQRLGGLDLYAYCDHVGRATYGSKYINYKSYPENEKDAYSWKCAIFTNHVQGTDAAYEIRGYNTDEVCRYQHGSGAYSRVGDPKDAYSWSCYQ